MKYPGIDDFLKRYPQKAAEAKVDPLGFYLPPFNYAIGQMLEQAVSATKSLDRSSSPQYLHTNEVKTIVGPISWGKDGEWAQAARGAGAVPRRQGQGRRAVPPAGKQVVVYPAQYKTGDAIMPFEKARGEVGRTRQQAKTARRSRAVFLDG